MQKFWLRITPKAWVTDYNAGRVDAEDMALPGPRYQGGDHAIQIHRSSESGRNNVNACRPEPAGMARARRGDIGTRRRRR